MFALIGYPVGIVFLIVAISLGIKGFMYGMRDLHELRSHKNHALYYTYSILCGLIAFELFYPKWESLICLPTLLIGVWLEYLIAALMLRRRK